MQEEIVHYVAALSPFMAHVTVTSIQVQLHWRKCDLAFILRTILFCKFILAFG